MFGLGVGSFGALFKPRASTLKLMQSNNSWLGTGEVDNFWLEIIKNENAVVTDTVEHLLIGKYWDRKDLDGNS